MSISISIITVTYNRSQLFQDRALSSILSQRDKDFEWIVINDGRNAGIKSIIDTVASQIPLVYLEMEHSGFGLCKGRNLGIAHSHADLISYLDDDNLLYPEFVSTVKDFYKINKHINYFCPIQSRRRDIVENGDVVKKGTPFLSLTPETTAIDIINPTKVLFDSNGFVHKREGSPFWDEDLRIYCDYEYFLQCVGIWGLSSFGVIPEILIEYIQTNEGEVGKSNYSIWTKELEAIWRNKDRYPVLSLTDADKWFPDILKKYFDLAKQNNEPKAFKL